jgi:hypothetical protein
MRNARKVEYLGKFETEIENVLGCFIRSIDGLVWPNHLKTKKSHASVPLRHKIHIRCVRWDG